MADSSASAPEVEVMGYMLPLNLTPHNLNIHLVDGRVLVLPSEDTPARCVTEPQKPVALDGWPAEVPICTPQTFVGTEGLPENTRTNIVVSRVVADYLRSSGGLRQRRGHVFSPDTGPNSVVRNEEGNIVGVRQLELWV